MSQFRFENAVRQFAEDAPNQWPEQVVFRDERPLYLPAPANGYRFGDSDLPIARYRRAYEELLGGLSEGIYPIAFIEGETGCGKTTNGPLAALESGLFDKILVAQPYILLARETRKRLVYQLSKDMGCDASDLVGYATAADSELHADNRIVCGTHGYIQGLIAHASSHELGETLLMVDEYHDRGVEGDTVLEVGKARQVPSIVMSATMNSAELARHHCQHDGTPAPILKMEGRTFPIKEIAMDNSTAAASWAVQQGYDTLYMLPRKADVEREMSRLAVRIKRPHVLLPLHSEMPPSEQEQALRRYDLPRAVVATEIAGTGLTPDVDAVVVSGIGRTTSLQKGVSALTIQHLPEAKVRQQIGRCGRDRPGIAIRAPYDKTPKDLPPNPDIYDKPEIMRTRLDSLLLRLGSAGLRIGNTEIGGGTAAQRLDYSDLPSEKENQYAIERLQRMGALALDLTLTDTGEEMATLPVDVQYARMIVSARDYSEEIHKLMIAAACVAQFNGVVTSKGEGKWEALSGEYQADMLRDLDLYIKATQMSPDEYANYSILPQRIEKITQHIGEIYKREGYESYIGEIDVPTTHKRKQLTNCILSGSEELFMRQKGSKGYRDPRDKRIRRQLMSESALPGTTAVVAGTPWNLETISDSGRLVRKYFITNGVEVDLSQLAAVLPERCKYIENEYEITETGDIVAHHELYFDNRPTGYKEQRSIGEAGEDIRDFVMDGLFRVSLAGEEKLPEEAWRFRKEINALRDLEHRASYGLGVEELLADIRNELLENLPTSFATLDDMFSLLDSNSVRGFLTNRERKEIQAMAPDKIEVKGVNGQSIKLNVTYYDKNAYLDLANHEVLRSLPDLIPGLDGRKVYVRIGNSSKCEDYYTMKVKYAHTRSNRRKAQK